jgi:hypothetical protein
MAGAAIEVEGLPGFRKDLKDLDAAWPKELTKVHKAVAKEGAEGARGIAIGMGGQAGKMADALVGRATATQAKIAVSNTKGRPFANAAFWGAKKHSGWYANPRYKASGKAQFKPWVGSSWQPATFDGGPYAINRALALDLPHLLQLFEIMIDELTERAFPVGASHKHLPN